MAFKAETAADLSDDDLGRINRSMLVASVVRGAVHTVNNILQTIGGQAELLGQRPTLDDDVRHRLERIAAQTGRAASLMRDLSMIGRDNRPAGDRTDLRLGVERVLSLRQYDLSRAQISAEITGEQPGTCLTPIEGQAFSLAVLNLLLNAEQALAGQTGGRIVIAVERGDLEHVVSVIDNGPGVPADSRGKVFERFFTTGRPGSTLGIGLPVARGIAERHGGRLTLAAAVPGHPGARFDLTLPAL